MPRFLKDRVSSTTPVIKVVLGLLLFATAFNVKAQNVSVDFTDATGYGLQGGGFMIQNLRVDTTTPNPQDPNRPTIVSNYYNIPWSFDIGTLRLIPDLSSVVEINGSSRCATLQVYVTNAYNGQPVANAQVQVGSSFAMSDSAGLATFTGLVSGAAYIQSSAANYVGAHKQVTLSCNQGLSVGIAMNPQEGSGALAANEVRITLTWGENPRDLDSHLTGPTAASNGTAADTTNRFHIYYSSKTVDVAALDVDDTSSYGPETVTISPPAGASTLRPGLYRYSVHHYSGSNTITTSDASVSLKYGNITRTYSPPSGAVGSRDLWTVFELLVNSAGQITVYPVNSLTADQSASAVALTATEYGEIESGFDPTRLPPK